MKYLIPIVLSMFLFPAGIMLWERSQRPHEPTLREMTPEELRGAFLMSRATLKRLETSPPDDRREYAEAVDASLEIQAEFARRGMDFRGLLR